MTDRFPGNNHRICRKNSRRKGQRHEGSLLAYVSPVSLALSSKFKTTTTTTTTDLLPQVSTWRSRKKLKWEKHSQKSVGFLRLFRSWADGLCCRQLRSQRSLKSYTGRLRLIVFKWWDLYGEQHSRFLIETSYCKSRAALLTFSCPEDTRSGISCSCHLASVRTGILLIGCKGKWQCFTLQGGMTSLITAQSFMRQVLPSGICQPMVHRESSRV